MKIIARILILIFCFVLLAVTAFADEVVEVEYRVGDTVLRTDVCNVGSTISPPNVGREGYFVSWVDGQGREYLKSTRLTESTVLYASYSLMPAVAFVEDVSITYDGDLHSLEIIELYHPLMSDGNFSFEWYKDGDLVSDTAQMSVCDVSDTGRYSLSITFSYGGDSVVTLIENILVDISRLSLAVPIIPPLEYTGEPLMPTVPDSRYYGVEITPFTDVGTYYAILTLKDSENLSWDGTDSVSLCVPFEITAPTAVTDDLFAPEPTDTSTSISIGAVVFLITLLFAVSALVLLIVMKRALAVSCASVSASVQETEAEVEKRSIDDDEDEDDEYELCLGLVERGCDPMTPHRADSLISDAMAKDLVKKCTDVIYTSGSVRASVGVGELCSVFSAGERVDVNSMKARGLIGEDVLHVEIEAIGSIDLPLRVYADSFSLTAVKMIVLSGGEVYKTRSCKV